MTGVALTQAELRRLAGLRERATAGDWYTDDPRWLDGEIVAGEDRMYVGQTNRVDAVFIVELHNAIPAILADLEEAVDAMREIRDAPPHWGRLSDAFLRLDRFLAAYDAEAGDG